MARAEFIVEVAGAGEMRAELETAMAAAAPLPTHILDRLQALLDTGALIDIGPLVPQRGGGFALAAEPSPDLLAVLATLRALAASKRQGLGRR